MTGWGNIFIAKYVCTIMHHVLRTGMNISHRKLWKQKVQVSWDFSIHTDRTIQAKKPHITIKDHNEKHAN